MSRRIPVFSILMAATALALTGAPPAGAAPAAAQSASAQDSTRTLVHSGSRAATLRMDGDDGSDVRLRFHGRVVLDPATGTVRSVSPGGFLEVEEWRDGGARREVQIEPDAGGLRHVHRVNGQERPFDDDARAWLARRVRGADREMDRIDDELRNVARELERVGEDLDDFDVDLSGLADLDLDLDRLEDDLEDLDVDLSGLDASLRTLERDLPAIIAGSLEAIGPAIEAALESAADALDTWHGDWHFDDDDVVDLDEVRRDLDHDLRHMDRDLRRMERDIERELRRSGRLGEREVAEALERARRELERARRER